MEWTEALILSIVQGVAEWLPISSSGHLVLFAKWLDIKEASLTFDVFLHIASLAVILLFFKKQIIEIIKAPFNSKENSKENWWWYLIISNIFTAAIGYYLYQNIDSFRTIDSVSNWFLITSILLLASKFTKGDKSLTWKHAVVLGIIQGLAVLPGLSRSGAVIALALAMKIKKTQAFNYAFIVAIPAMFGSFLLTARGFVFEPIYILAFGLTFVIGYLSLVLLKLIMKRDYFYLFFVYTLILSLILKFT
ncbi:MAG: undecaprenyl-diphosphate phosphatase [Candidatus Komeilibacteria bacterium]|jgi:undecaprenyl-diphosphatase|nr:undecaprenyl-diphosphate phosphatase [Candidatus Komeilibacteria bacterium]